MQKEQIIQYYDTCEIDYRLLWDLEHSLAMHAGFWDSRVKTLREALQRENEVLAEMANIQKGETVLDAGCGVGGSSIFLAQRYGCRVTGITLSAKQVQKASEYARKLAVEPLPSFQVMDYTQTHFEDSSFDVVWGVESVCHAQDKSLFIKEAFRVLKQGGRLIIADGFAIKDSYDPEDRILMERWLKGWGVQSLETINNFENYLKKTGFKNIAYRDATSHVIPSSRRLYLYSWPAWLVSKLGEYAGWRSKVQTENICGACYQYPTLKKGLWQYGIFYAEK
jgi:tocopherol O-methyltransferase